MLILDTPAACVKAIEDGLSSQPGIQSVVVALLWVWLATDLPEKAMPEMLILQLILQRREGYCRV